MTYDHCSHSQKSRRINSWLNLKQENQRTLNSEIIMKSHAPYQLVLLVVVLIDTSYTCVSRSSSHSTAPQTDVIDEEPPQEDSLIRSSSCDDLIAMHKVRSAVSPAYTGQCRSDLISNCPIRSYRYRLEGTVTIPTALHATITRANCTGHDLRPSSFLDRQMSAMGTKTADRHGHLISPEFCGPSEWFNLVPFSPALYAEDDNEVMGRLDWDDMERLWRRHVEAHGEKIQVYIFLDSESASLEGKESPRRPTGFRVCAQYLQGYAEETGTDDWYFLN